jgi:hypothetical protein
MATRRNLSKRTTAKNTPAHTAGAGEQAAPFVAERGGHLVTAALDYIEKSFDDVIGAHGLLVRLGEGVEGQAGVEVALQARDGGGIALFVLGAEGGHRLVGLGPACR